MTKLRKFLIFIIVLLLVAGGVFYWKNQQEVADLNNGLPDGIKVVKTLTGDYVVVNKIDGYSFKVPDGWEGIKEIEYTPERTVKDFTLTSIGVEGINSEARDISIDYYGLNEDNIELEAWADALFNTFGLSGDLNRDNVGEIDIVKTQETEHLLGMYIYFFKKNQVIYVISGGSEEFIREIIINGKW